VDADFNKALELYKKAANGGYYRALYNMGVCHENGEGVPRDSAKVWTQTIEPLACAG
jgi:TPR repeat protein